MTPAPHLTDGQLRAHLDAELAAADARHLSACPQCQARLADLAARQTTLAARFAALAPRPDDPALAARPAFARFAARHTQQEKVTMLQRLFNRSLRPVWAALSVVAVLTVALAFEPVRAWAGQFLGLFRIQQVTLLPLDLSTLPDIAGNQALGERMAQVFSESFTVDREALEPRRVASAAEASDLAGFPVRELRTDLAGPAYLVTTGSTFEFTVDRAQAQAIVAELGRGDLELPAALDGATVNVDIPAGVSAAYGDCQALSESEFEGRSSRRGLENCALLVQLPSPTVTTPPDVDLTQLAQIALQLTGMSAQEARAFSRTVDWTSTLVIPIPQDADYEAVSVDGVNGYVMGQNEPDGYYTLVWVKDGRVYALSGFGAWERGLALAKTLR